MPAETAKKVADLLRRKGRTAQVRKGHKRSERRVFVRLKRGEYEWGAQKLLGRSVNALLNLGLRTPEQRSESAKKAAETRLENRAEDKMLTMNRGFVFEILRDHALKPSHYRKQKIETTPRKKGARVRGANVSDYGYMIWSGSGVNYRISDDKKAVKFTLGAVVSKNIALEVAEAYQGHDGFSMETRNGEVYIFISVETSVNSLSDKDHYEKLADIRSSGVFTPDSRWYRT